MDLTASTNPFLDLFDGLSSVYEGTVDLNCAFYGLLVAKPSTLLYTDEYEPDLNYLADPEAAIALLDEILPNYKWGVLEAASIRARHNEADYKQSTLCMSRNYAALPATEVFALAICTEMMLHFRDMALANDANHRAPPSEGK